MGRMTDEIRGRINSHLAEAKESRHEGDWNRCWQLLEDAHVLSQPWARPHTKVHAAMLAAGWRSRDGLVEASRDHVDEGRPARRPPLHVA